MRNRLFYLLIISTFLSCAEDPDRTKTIDQKYSEYEQAECGKFCIGPKCKEFGECKVGFICILNKCVKEDELTDIDTGNTGDDGNSGNSGNSGDSDSDKDIPVLDEEPDEDADLIADDDIVLPFCGNDIWEEGEACDGNSSTCSSLGIGILGTAECREDCSGWVTEGVCQRIFKCSNKPENTIWNTVSEYTQTWNGTEWVPAESTTEHNETTSSTECRYICDSSNGYVRDISIFICRKCGDGIKEGEEVCDDGANNGQYKLDSPGYCNSICSGYGEGGYCGDGMVHQVNEVCDINMSGNTLGSATIDCNFYNTVYYSSSVVTCSPGCKGYYTNQCRFCGDGIISDGEVCDINSIECSKLGIGTSGTANCNGSCNNWSTAGNCQKTYSCLGLPANSVYYNDATSYVYNQTWDGSAWAPADSSASYNAVPSVGTCQYKCNINFTWNESECVADQKTFNCSDKPSNTQWNTVSSYIQTWNVSAWLPAESTTEYNETASSTSCRYICDTSYAWNGSSCAVPECITDQTQFIECGTDPTKWQKQICDGSGFWQDFEGCVDYRNTVLCTGQTKCYNTSKEITCPISGDFYGQDAQYAVLGYCIPKSFTVSGTAPEEIVTDDNTGLQWQRTPSESTFNWVNAIAHCDGLTYGGYKDWRLPTIKEFATLPDYGRGNPAIDPDVFPGTHSHYYWSSSSNGSTTEWVWYIVFDISFSSSTGDKTKSYYARCVRGEEWNPENTFEEITVSDKVIIKDTKTGLEWTKEYATGKTWQQALDYCETLNYGDYTDWRLPNIEELKTLIDYSLIGPASSFPGIPPMTSDFWASTSNVADIANAWRVNFSSGYFQTANKTASYMYVLCVR